MKKEDLKSGMVVETRNGELYLVVGDFITKDNGFLVLEEFENNLKIKSSFKFLDIVKVYERYNDIYKKYASSLKTLFDKKHLKLLWESKEITLTDREKEILKALDTLGYDWLSRDKNDKIYAFGTKPEKRNHMWLDNSIGNPFTLDKHLFKFIKWEDENPTNIKELLK